MSGIFQITVQEARGAIAVPADIDQLAVVLGHSSLGSGLSSFFLSGSSAVTALGHGDGVDTLCQMIEQRQRSGSAVKVPAAMYTLPVDTDGSYGAVDDDEVTGTVVTTMDSDVKPYGTYEAYLRITNAGLIGTAGIKFVWSLDNGRTESRVTALGTDTTYTIPNSNVKFEFAPASADLTALNTLLNEMKDDYDAHRVLIAGGEHGAADNTNSIAAADATDTASRVALANDLRAKYNAHRILTAGGVHGAADNTNAITAPVATDDSSALILALDLKAKYNAHRILTAGSVHGAADNTNGVSSADPSAGAFAAGDIVRVRTFGPQPSTDDVDEAFTALKNASADFAIVVLDFDCDAAMAAHVTTGLNELEEAGKIVTAIVRTRLPDFEDDETETAWGTDVGEDFEDFDDSRILVRSGYGLVTDAMTTRQYLRSTMQQFAADVVRVPRFVWPCAPADRPQPNVALVDGDGVDVGHDEGPRGAFTGLSNPTLGNRFSCEQRLPDPTRREDVFNTVPWVMYAEDERIRNLMTRRLANAMKRVARAAATPDLGSHVFYESTGEGTGTLTVASRNAIQGEIYQAIRGQFRNEIDNAEDAALDSGLVQVAPEVTVSGGNLVGVSVTLAPKVGGFVLTIGLTLAIQE